LEAKAAGIRKRSSLSVKELRVQLIEEKKRKYVNDIVRGKLKRMKLFESAFSNTASIA